MGREERRMTIDELMHLFPELRERSADDVLHIIERECSEEVAEREEE